MTLRVRSETRQEMDAFALREQRTLSNLATVLLQWAFEKLKAAGSVHELMQGKEATKSTRSKEPTPSPDLTVRVAYFFVAAS